MMSAIVTCLFEGSPPCSWGSLLGEGSTNLKTLILLLSQWNHHLNCSIPTVGLLSGPSYSSLGGTFSFPGWNVILNCVILLGVNYTLTIDRLIMTVIYCDPESSNLMRCGVWNICSVTGVVCHGMTCCCVLRVLNGVVLSSCGCWLCLSHCCDWEQPLCKSQ